MRLKRGVLIVLITMLLIQSITGKASDRAKLVHNTYQEIETCKGKLQLKLIRIWGGDKEQDEQKFFRFPCAIAVDAKENVYICDLYNFCVKVFDFDGKHLRTIGQKGRGPGDLVGPGDIDFSPDGSLWVAERGGRRMQCFDASGKSKTIFRHKGIPTWMAVTAKNEIAVYCRLRTFESRKLLSFYNSKGKLKREIGIYHDKSKQFIGSEMLFFAKDAGDNFYAANTRKPIVRKYSSNGSLSMAFTFETPSKIRPKITLNEKGDEIQRLDGGEASQFRVKRKGESVIIERREGKDDEKEKFGGCIAIGCDSHHNIYIAALRRHYTEKESNATRISGNYTSFTRLDRRLVDFDIVENIDVHRLLVFNPAGKVIAEAPLSVICDEIYVHGNRIFIVDGTLNQRILEYELIFKK